MKKSPIHTRLINLMAAGELVSAVIVDKHFPASSKNYSISPAMLLTFKPAHSFNNGSGCVYTLRKELWADYTPFISVPILDKRKPGGDVYFKEIKVPHGEGHFWMPIPVDSKQSYWVHTSGVVAVHYNNGVERQLTPYLAGNHSSEGKMYVKINAKMFALKHLVAGAVYPEYKKGQAVIHLDRDLYNCDYTNLRVVSPSVLGTHTGHLSRGQKVVAVKNGTAYIYRSVRACAKDINCSYQTLLDYLGGLVKNSICEPYQPRYCLKQNKAGGSL